MKAKVIGESKETMICTPLVAKNREGIVAELREVLIKQPDIIEWRADFFAGIANTREVVGMAQELSMIARDIPLIFTIRSMREGGQPIMLSAEEAIELNAAICKETDFAYVDCELSNLPQHITYLCSVAAEAGTKIIGSYHNFECTPGRDFLAGKFTEAEQYGLDVAKIAVMPQKLDDVLALLSATLEARNTLTIPIITMSMGRYGAVSRLVGGVFGSSLSFAVGVESSAPGQIPVDDLRTVLGIIEKTMG